jgi:hypothetical protein
MQVCGIFVKSNSIWCSPIRITDKKNGDPRLTIDFRKLNEVTIKDAYPMPNIEEIFPRLVDAVFYSKIDLSSGYFQIPLEPESRQYTAFGCKFGFFEFTVMPMGLTNAPATIQRPMDNILEEFIQQNFCIAYMDDTIIYSRTLDEHEKQVLQVLDCLSSYGLTIKAEKCEFVRKEIIFLGQVISHGTIAPGPDKIEAIRRYERPATVKQLQSFIGLASYYRKYIKDFSKIASPLHGAITSKNRLQWRDECEQAFIKLRDFSTVDIVLALPDFNKDFRLETDASDYGVGAVLSQVVEGKERPVAYFSKHLGKAQRKNSTTKRSY